MDPRDAETLSTVRKLRLLPFAVHDPGSVLALLDELTGTRPE
jgi:hypothetical protein